MALIQVNVSDETKRKTDEAFARSGLTTPSAMKVMLTQVATTGISPFDGLFLTQGGLKYSENVRRDMVRAEAQELGLLPDNCLEDPTTVPSSILADLGISPEEVGQ